MNLREYKALARNRAKSEKAREKLEKKFESRKQKMIKKLAAQGGC